MLKKTVSSSTSELLKQYLYATGFRWYRKICKSAGILHGWKDRNSTEASSRTGKLSGFLYRFCTSRQSAAFGICSSRRTKRRRRVPQCTFAQEIAKGIFEETLPYLNIYPDEDIVVTEETDPAEAPADGNNRCSGFCTGGFYGRPDTGYCRGNSTHRRVVYSHRM